MTPLHQLDLSKVHVLDGAMATELENKGFDLSGPLWSAHVLQNSPEAIAAVHREYLDAGADCLLTASYQVSEEGFVHLGYTPEDATRAAKKALKSSVAIAEKVRDEYRVQSPRSVWIAASLGPYGAMLHNGAEYHGNYECSFEELIGFHSRRMAIMVETHADLLAFESIPSLEEARAILTALQAHPLVAAYLSFTCQDGKHISHGETMRTCAELLDPHAQVIAIGINCTSPVLIESLIEEVKNVTRKPIVVYPNSGEQWDAVQRCWMGDGQVKRFGELAKIWRDAGAQWIGGCCRTGPEHVRAVADLFASG